MTVVTVNQYHEDSERRFRKLNQQPKIPLALLTGDPVSVSNITSPMFIRHNLL